MKAFFMFAFLFATTALFAQGKQLYVKFVEIGTWNTYTRHWEYGERQESNLVINLSGRVVTINNNANTTLITGQVYDDTKENGVLLTSWWATDQNNKQCIFTMRVDLVNKTELYTIMYNDVAIRYWLQWNSLDNLKDN